MYRSDDHWSFTDLVGLRIVILIPLLTAIPNSARLGNADWSRFRLENGHDDSEIKH